MPITNDAFCAGFAAKATPWATCPYPQASNDAWAWQQGHEALVMPSSTRVIVDGSKALMELLADTGKVR